MRVRSQERKNQILSFINSYYSFMGVAPTYEEIANHFNVDKSTIARYLKEMESEKTIDFNTKHRGISTDFIENYKNVRSVSVVGEVACGVPILAEQNISGQLLLSADILGEGEFFALKAQGESMINAGIDNGDYVIIRRQNTATEGQIVLALVDNSATIKRFFIDNENKKIRLHPENDEMTDMFFDSIEIQGVVKKIIKDCDF